MSHYTTIANVIAEYVSPALGAEADDFDLDAIAHEIATYDAPSGAFIVDEDAFWASVERNAIA